MPGMNCGKLKASSGHRNFRLAISIVCIAVMEAAGWMTSVSIAHASSPLNGRFNIGKEGRLILLPVEFAGSKYNFMLDTGASRSGFDITLRHLLGPSLGFKTLVTFAGLKKVELFDWPEALLGEQSLKTETPVVCVDFSELRTGSNEQIYGIIGMDVLKNCCFQIDFDRGIIQFLATRSAPDNDWGTRIPIEISVDGNPYICGKITETTSEKFVIDTGGQGNSLESGLFDELLADHFIRVGGSFTSRTVAGDVSGNRGKLSLLSIAPFEHEGLRVARMNISTLGLRYLSRYRVTFDFQKAFIYLKKGNNYLKPEPRATSGMTLSWIEGKITVGVVKKEGPAADAGVLPNDVLLKIDGIAAASFDHFALRKLLTSEGGRQIPLVIHRADRQINLTLVLEDD